MRLPALLVHGAALAVAGAVLVAAAQPLIAEDTWWHLAIGRAYAQSGPWLVADPFLFTAAGPPAPAAWASGVALHAVERAVGFPGLRALHALLVAAILAAAWRALRRASGSPIFASLGTALLAALAAYRLFQLRPELVTILATVVGLDVLQRASPTAHPRAALAGVALLFALWANAHGGFVLGLALLGAAALATGAAALRATAPPETRARARQLGAAWAAALLGSLVNPIGARAHALYLAAGADTPDLGQIADEWAPLHLLSLPVAHLPPSPTSWAIVWALWIATPAAVLWHARARRAPRAAQPLDPALLAVAATALVAMLSAVRLVWLGIAPLLAIGQAARALGATARRGGAWAAAVAAVLLAPAFARIGDWPMISRGIHPAVYHRPYPPEKFHAHAVWFLRDAALEGRLWNDYQSGNFLGYWLAPRLRVFVNGSLNVPPEVMADGAAIRARAGRPGETFTALLDRHAIDVFFATGAPAIPRANQPARYSTAHLENTAGWLTVFRNVDSAVYLRANERNRANLDRVAAHYAREGMPFDPQRGFDVEAVIRASPPWAAAHGILPADWRELDAAARARTPAARARLATVYAVLGGYEAAAAIDRELLRDAPRSLRAARRLTWSLLHLERGEELGAAAEELAAIAPAPGTLAYALALAARELPPLDADAARALVARLPLFTEREAQQALATFAAPPALPAPRPALRRPRRRAARRAQRSARLRLRTRARATAPAREAPAPRPAAPRCAAPRRSARHQRACHRSAARSRADAAGRTGPRASSAP